MALRPWWTYTEDGEPPIGPLPPTGEPSAAVATAPSPTPAPWQPTTVQNTPDTGTPGPVDFGAMAPERAYAPGFSAPLSDIYQAQRLGLNSYLAFGSPEPPPSPPPDFGPVTEEQFPGEHLLTPQEMASLDPVERRELARSRLFPAITGGEVKERLGTLQPLRRPPQFLGGPLTSSFVEGELPGWLPDPVKRAIEVGTSPLGLASLAVPALRIPTLASLGGSAAAGTAAEVAGATPGQTTLAELIGGAAPFLPGAGVALRGAKTLGRLSAAALDANVPGAAQVSRKMRGVPRVAGAAPRTFIDEWQKLVDELPQAPSLGKDPFTRMFQQPNILSKTTAGALIPRAKYPEEVGDLLVNSYRLQGEARYIPSTQRAAWEQEARRVFDMPDGVTIRNIPLTAGTRGGQTFRLEDIIDRPELYNIAKFTRPQRDFLTRLRAFTTEMYDWQKAQNIEPGRFFGARADDPLANIQVDRGFLPHKVLANPEGLPARPMVSGGGIRGGASKHRLPRAFPTQAEGLALGYPYAKTFDALEDWLAGIGSNFSTKYIRDRAKLLGVLPTEKGGWITAKQAEIDARLNLQAIKPTKDAAAIAAARNALDDAIEARRIASERARQPGFGKGRVAGMGARDFSQETADALNEFYAPGKSLPIVKEIVDAFRVGALNLDSSALGAQGKLAMVQHFPAWVEGAAQGTASAFKDSFWRQILADPGKAEIIRWSSAHGASYPLTTPEVQLLNQSALLKIPVAEKVFRKGGQLYERQITLSRLKAIEAEYEIALAKYNRPFNQLTQAEIEAARETASRRGMRLSGGFEHAFLGIGPGRAQTEAQIVISPTFWRNALGNALQLTPGSVDEGLVTSALARLFGLVVMAGVGAQAKTGQKFEIDPRSSQFFDIPLGNGRYVNVLGNYKPLARILASGGLAGAEAISGKEIGGTVTATGRPLQRNPIIIAARYATGKLTPPFKATAGELGLPVYYEREENIIKRLAQIFSPLSAENAPSNPELVPFEMLGESAYQLKPMDGTTTTIPGRVPVTQVPWEDLSDRQREQRATPFAAQAFPDIPWDELSDLQHNAALGAAQTQYEGKKGKILESPEAIAQGIFAQRTAKEGKAELARGSEEENTLAAHLYKTDRGESIPFGALPNDKQKRIRELAIDYAASEIPAVTQTWEDLAKARFNTSLGQIGSADQQKIIDVVQSPKFDPQTLNAIKTYYRLDDLEWKAAGGPPGTTRYELMEGFYRVGAKNGMTPDEIDALPGVKALNKKYDDELKKLQAGYLKFYPQAWGFIKELGQERTKPTTAEKIAITTGAR